MSKVICDVCGTAYPETSATCPICGSAKNTSVQTAAGSESPEEGRPYTYVKGGRFSKSNVRKRTQQHAEPSRQEQPERSRGGGGNAGLIAVVIVLVLAIVVIAGYITVRYFSNRNSDNPSLNNNTETQTPSASSSQPVSDTVPCTGLTLDKSSIEFSTAGSAWLLGVVAEPADTTDQIIFTSSNEAVATVNEVGNVQAVGGGEATITVTCGSITAECTVVCGFQGGAEPSTEPTEAPVDVPAGFELKLNRKDFTLSKASDSWTLYKETDGIKASDITWTSADPKVATVEDGVVKGVNYGDTTITATIGDQTASCIVRVRFYGKTDDDNGDGDGDEETGQVHISHTDATIAVGETFQLTLTTAEGVKINVEWTPSQEDYVNINGSQITGKAVTPNGGITLTATYEDVTYSCIVRVKAAD